MTEPWRKLRLDVVDVIARSVEGAGSSWFSQALRRKVRSEHVALVGGEKRVTYHLQRHRVGLKGASPRAGSVPTIGFLLVVHKCTAIGFA